MIHNIGEACTGCSACASICSRKAIEMLRDKEGFLYPEVEPEKCSQCGKCSRVCHLDVKPQSTCESMTYAGVCINDEIRMGSSSGGVFSVLAQSVFQDGGAVCGAVLSDDFKSLQHTVVWNEADLEALRGSKYLQSSMEDVYSEIRALLEEKCPVLFCGTPCQVSGLNRYLGKEYEHLLCVDMICHGAPSPKLWEKYVGYRERCAGMTIKKINFRNKRNGWKQSSMFFDFGDKSYIKNSQEDLYMRMFLSNISLRPSCYQCKNKGEERYSDITLGDFWGIQNIMPEFDDDKGVSLIITNTMKGRDVLAKVCEQLKLHEVERETALKENTAYYHSPKVPAIREKFMLHLNEWTLLQLYNRCMRKYLIQIKLKRWMRRFTGVRLFSFK